jgi:nucleoside phosphorylase
MNASDFKGRVDFGILTIREDEFDAVLRSIPERVGVALARRRYRVRRLPLGNDESYTIAIVRCVEQGNTDALNTARDLLEDVDPQFLLVVGIAGGVPSYEFTLGDVIVSTRVTDFSVEAVLKDHSREYAAGGGSLHPKAAALAADIRAMVSEGELAGWNTRDVIQMDPPPVDLADANFYGDDDWQRDTRKQLERHFAGKAARPPVVITGPIASSDRLIKEAETLQIWLKFARHVQAVEMESAGIYKAAHGRVPFLAIRGISDIVGFKRNPDWTEYACRTAASFMRSFLLTRPIEPRAKELGVMETSRSTSETREAPTASTASAGASVKRSIYEKCLAQRAAWDAAATSTVEDDVVQLRVCADGSWKGGIDGLRPAVIRLLSQDRPVREVSVLHEQLMDLSREYLALESAATLTTEEGKRYSDLRSWLSAQLANADRMATAIRVVFMPGTKNVRFSVPAEVGLDIERAVAFVDALLRQARLANSSGRSRIIYRPEYVESLWTQTDIDDAVATDFATRWKQKLQEKLDRPSGTTAQAAWKGPGYDSTLVPGWALSYEHVAVYMLPAMVWSILEHVDLSDAADIDEVRRRTQQAFAAVPSRSLWNVHEWVVALDPRARLRDLSVAFHPPKAASDVK